MGFDIRKYKLKVIRFLLNQAASPITWLWKCHASRGVDAILRSGPGEGKDAIAVHYTPPSAKGANAYG